MCKVFAIIWMYYRLMMDSVVDFIFSLFWKKKKMPPLKKSDRFLAESAVTLARRIKQKELKSEDLVLAVIERIKTVNSMLNAVAEECFESALLEAKQVDRLIEAGLSDEEAQRKPFLGVPFTTKEFHMVKGLRVTIGLRCRRDIKATKDCDSVTKLKDAGAILVATTNVPEMVLWQETRNMVYGMTLNPHHTGRTPGGSSGGEAALMAVYGTPISLCKSSDLGGSIRMPAFYCGLFGHHPTPGTTNCQGIINRKGDESSMLSLGFITKHAEDLAPLTSVLTARSSDLLTLDTDVDIKSLKFYYTESSSDLLVSPIRQDLKDTMKKVIEQLESVTSVANRPQKYNHRSLRYMYSMWSKKITKEPEDYTSMYFNNARKPCIFVEIMKKLFCMSEHCWTSILHLVRVRVERRLFNLDKMDAPLQELKDDLINKLGDTGVLLFPSAPHAAPPHYTFFLRPFNFAYWAVINALEFPATQVPIGVSGAGLPLGVQVVCAPRRDALCLAVARYLETQFGGAVLACDVLT